MDFLSRNKRKYQHQTWGGDKEKAGPVENIEKEHKKLVFKQDDFAYAGRDTVYQVEKIAPGLIKNISNEVNNVAQQRINQINQIISQWRKEVERVLQKILRGAIEDIYQTVLSCHVTYAFQSKSTLNVQELLAPNRCEIWSLSDDTGLETRTT